MDTLGLADLDELPSDPIEVGAVGMGRVQGNQVDSGVVLPWHSLSWHKLVGRPDCPWRKHRFLHTCDLLHADSEVDMKRYWSEFLHGPSVAFGASDASGSVVPHSCSRDS